MGVLIVIIVCVFGWMSGLKEIKDIKEGHKDGVVWDEDNHTQYIFYGDGDFGD